MRIYIKEEKGQVIHLRLPTGLVFNRFTALFIPGACRKRNINITYQQAVQFLRALHSYRRRHKDWVLAEVDSANGDKVFVKL